MTLSNVTPSTLTLPEPRVLGGGRNLSGRDAARARAAGLRVLHVLPAFFGGGMERFLAGLLHDDGVDDEWRDLRHGVCILRDADEELLATLDADTPLWRLGRSGGSWRRDYGCWWRLRRVIRAFQPDVVEALSTGAWMDAALATRGLRGVRLVLGFHGRTDLDRPSRRRLWCNRWAAARAESVFTVSGEARDMLAEDWGLPVEKLRVVPNGLDVRRFRPPENESIRLQIREQLGVGDAGFVAVCVANLTPVKQLPILLKAWANLPPADARAHLLIAGDGPLRSELEQASARMGCRAWVHFLGNREDVPRLLQAADLFVLSSAYEACSMAVLEAMASGLPVVATAVGGLPELVRPGKTGWLTPPRSPHELTFVLRAAIAGPETRRRFGLAGRAIVERHFSMDACRRRYVEMYADQASRSRCSGAGKEQPACAE